MSMDNNVTNLPARPEVDSGGCYDAHGMVIKSQVVTDNTLADLLARIANWLRQEHLDISVTDVCIKPQFGDCDGFWEAVVYWDVLSAKLER